jgi:protein-tyrosine phosphatase
MSESVPLILFVCTGNQIRSPLASAIFQRFLGEAGLSALYRTDSAGTWAIPGQFDLFATETARQMGLNIEEHRSKSITRDLIGKARLLIVMELGQKEGLEAEYPQSRSKVRLLSEMAGEPPYDIPDPVGKGLDQYLKTGNELLTLIQQAFNSIIHFSER